MGKKKKREDPPGPQGAPEWVVTFTDMISLLVTFFVLLMTFSSMDAYDALKVDSFLDGAKGVHKSRGFDAVRPPEADVLAASSLQRGAKQPHSRPADKLPESLEEMGKEQTDRHKAIDLNDVSDGLVIEFGVEESFAPGSTELSTQLQSSLIEIAKVLENYPHLVVVEGFTDGAFKPTPEYRNERTLSLARARNAAATMLANSDMTPELLQVAGLGNTTPRADNVSPGGRQLNRRVRLRVLSLSKVRATALAARQQEAR